MTGWADRLYSTQLSSCEWFLPVNATSHAWALKLCQEEKSGQSISRGFTSDPHMLPNTEKGLQPKALSSLLNTQAAEPEISGIPFETLPLCTK